MASFVSVHSLRCSYEMIGSGPDVLLLHGWGQSRAFWANLQPHLARRFTLHVIDLPGFGLSDEPPVTWGVAEYADFVHALVGTLGIGPPIVIGHSFGGKVAACYAARYPVRKLVLYSASGLPTHDLRKIMHGYLVQIFQHVAPNTIYRLHSVIFKPSGYRNESAITRARSRRMLAVYLRIYRANIEATVGAITADALLVYGRRDTIVPLDVGMRLARLMSRAELVILERAGHFAHFEEPERFLQVLDAFLQQDQKLA